MVKQRKVLIEKYNPEYPIHAMDDLFRELMRGCYEVKNDTLKGFIYLKKNGYVFMEQDLIHNIIWVSYNRFWVCFETFGMNYNQIQDFIQTEMKVHLNISEYKPYAISEAGSLSWNHL